MKIERQQVGTVEVCTPFGPLVEEDAQEFARALIERLRGPNPRVVVSLQEVPYIDSIALEGFSDAADELDDMASRLKLVKVTPSCREALELTGLSGRFQFFEEVRDAVRSFV
jgi:anti-anti-sigma factor